MDLSSVVVIGSGHVATHLSLALQGTGLSIVQVFSRTPAHGASLASKLGCESTHRLSQIHRDASLYLIAVSDHAMEEVVTSLPLVSGLVVHTGGSVDISVLSRFERYGVFYPFQTFSKSKALDLRRVPFFVEGSSKAVDLMLSDLAQRMSSRVEICSSEARRAIHLSAVFACNFVNHMYTLSAEILESYGIDFSVLYPLIDETTEKVKNLHPRSAQTGPAIRNDLEVMCTHLSRLKDDHYSSSIYELISASIQSREDEKK